MLSLKSAGTGNSNVLGVEQAGQKAGLAEQGSARTQIEKEDVQTLEARPNNMGGLQGCCLPLQGENVSLAAPVDVHKSMGSDEINPGVLKELADVITGPLSIIFQWC